MFDAAWKGLLCLGVLLVANSAIFLPVFYRATRAGPVLATNGWVLLILGSVTPLGAIFYTAARAGRPDKGIWLGVGFGILFLFRVACELGRISDAVAESSEQHKNDVARRM